MTINSLAILDRDARNHGVRRINILGLRVIYALMFFMLGQTVWTHIANHTGPWEADDAMAWSVWAAFSLLAGLGIIHPLKMLPILLLEIAYKVLWLVLVALPLWSTGSLKGAPEQYQTMVFIGVIVPIFLVPWGFVWRTFIVLERKPLP
jgi:hypothetical protein